MSKVAKLNNGAAELFALGIGVICVAAIFDPRFRKWCLNLLCRL